jgi:hypothetical protein
MGAQVRSTDVVMSNGSGVRTDVRSRPEDAPPDVSYVFAALGAALAAFGLITAGAVATGAWFGPIVWSRPRVLAREGGQCT